MKHFVPTYDQCVQITKENENFFEKKTVVEGKDVSVFNYRLATSQDFSNPLKNDDSVKAYELRGITFVHDQGQTTRYIMLHKFFNVDQTEGYMFSQVKHKKIVRIQDKADGSMIRFLKINGKLIAKTKVAFESEQAAMAMEVVNKNSRLKSFIEKTLENKLAAIFEIVSPVNQIVLQYEKTELLLLQLREESSGDYLDIYSHELVNEFEVKTTKKETLMSWDELMEMRKTSEGREGAIATTEDGQMLKFKTQWYMDRHGLLTQSMIRENDLVALVLNETLDDAMGMILENDPRRAYAESIQKSLAVYMERSFKEVLALMATFNGSRKDFALANRGNQWFPVAVKFIELPDDEKVFNLLKERVLYRNRDLMEAKEFVKNVLQVAPVQFVTTDDDN